MSFIKLSHKDTKCLITLLEDQTDPLSTQELETLDKLRQIYIAQCQKALAMRSNDTNNDKEIEETQQ
jgi:hypothetical protein